MRIRINHGDCLSLRSKGTTGGLWWRSDPRALSVQSTWVYYDGGMPESDGGGLWRAPFGRRTCFFRETGRNIVPLGTCFQIEACLNLRSRPDVRTHPPTHLRTHARTHARTQYRTCRSLRDLKGSRGRLWAVGISKFQIFERRNETADLDLPIEGLGLGVARRKARNRHKGAEWGLLMRFPPK